MESIEKSLNILDQSMIEMLFSIESSEESLISNHHDMGTILKQCRSSLLKGDF